MCSKELFLFVCLVGLLGGLRLTSTTTTTTFVAAMSIGNQDIERYFRSVNASQSLAVMTEDRIAMDTFTYAFINYSYYDEQHIKREVQYTEEKARYGEGRILSVKGKLVHVTDANDFTDDYACSPNILGTLGNPTPTSGVSWIALVRRGHCTFEEKVRNVHSKGAAGVIVYNDKPVMNLEKMQIKGKTRNITAVITYQEVGASMAEIVDRGFDMEAAIIEGKSGMRPINTLNRTSVLFVSISFIVLMVVSLVWLIFYYIQRFRYLQTKDQQSRHLCSVTKKAIMKIPTKTGKSSDEKDIDSDCCAICIEAYKASDCIRVLPCKHEFHKNCIDPWLIEHRTCPMCKLDVLKYYGYVFLGSEESILEYEPDRSTSNATSTGNAGGAISGQTPSGALSDLIRSREFVMEFPRFFVVDTSAASVTRESLFLARMPERSQSSLSLAQAKDWMFQMSNKLEQQHGLRYIQKNGEQSDMRENLLGIRADSLKKRRSHSADGRFSNGFIGRKEFLLQRQQQQQQEQKQLQLQQEQHVQATANVPATTSTARSRRNSDILRQLTDSAFAQSKQRQKELLNAAANKRESHRHSVISLKELNPREEVNAETTAADSSGNPNSTSITIQINGEGVDLD